MTTKVTVITALHNTGEYLSDVVSCLAKQTLQDFDWVIIDDNSTDPQTAQALAEVAQHLPQTQVTIIQQDVSKAGAGAAYRRAMQAASGQYILPLDAADKIADFYLASAARVLDENATVGVVYGQGQFFGHPSVFNALFNMGLDENIEAGRNFYSVWPLPAYSFPEILAMNMVFASAMFRRADYLETAGYREELASYQDYGLWVDFTELALQRQIAPGNFFYQLPTVVYYYRQHLTKANSPVSYGQACATIFRQHPALYEQHIAIVFERLLQLQGFFSAREI